jgi:fructuronate reductase
VLTSDVAPYERAKVRMLNGSHSTLAYLGQLAGYELVSDVMAAAGPIAAAVDLLMRADAIPTLAPVPELDFDAYRSQLLERFANPALAHRTAQIAMDGSQKLPQRLVGTISDRRRAGACPAAALLGVAAWIRYAVDRQADDGCPLTVEDPMADDIAGRAAGAPSAVVIDAMLGLPEIFPAQVAGDPVVRDALVEHLERLRRDGAEAAARAVVERG